MELISLWVQSSFIWNLLALADYRGRHKGAVPAFVTIRFPWTLFESLVTGSIWEELPEWNGRVPFFSCRCWTDNNSISCLLWSRQIFFKKKLYWSLVAFLIMQSVPTYLPVPSHPPFALVTSSIPNQNRIYEKKTKSKPIKTNETKGPHCNRIFKGKTDPILWVQ